MHSHLTLLEQKKSRLEKLIETVEKTIAYEKGEIQMSNEQKFEAFKDKLIQENEQNYGEEIREKYGEKTVEGSNAKFKNMTRAIRENDEVR